MAALPNVNTGDPHVAAHNAERAQGNATEVVALAAKAKADRAMFFDHTGFITDLNAAPLGLSFAYNDAANRPAGSSHVIIETLSLSEGLFQRVTNFPSVSGTTWLRFKQGVGAWSAWVKESDEVIASHLAAADPHPQYLTVAEDDYRNFATVIADGVDLNTVTTPNTYRRTTSVGTTTALNYPMNGWAGWIEVIASSSTSVIQRATALYSDPGANGITNNSWFRTCVSGTWGPWRPILTDDHSLNTAADPHTQYVNRTPTSVPTANLNTLISSGYYWIAYSADWAARNIPLADAGHLQVMRFGAGVLQWYQQPGTATYAHYFRKSMDSGATWGAWYREGMGVITTHEAALDPHSQYALKTGVTLGAGADLNTLTAAGDYNINIAAAANRPPGFTNAFCVQVYRVGGTIYQIARHGTTGTAGPTSNSAPWVRTSTDAGAAWTTWVLDVVSSLLAASNTFAAAQVISSDANHLVINRPGNAADARRWVMVEEASGALTFMSQTDAGVLQASGLSISRAGDVSLDGIQHIKGAGSPLGVVSAPVGSRYVDTAATTGALEWIKRTGGSGNTGWEVSYGDTGRRAIFAGAAGQPFTSGRLLLRRKNDRVYLSVESLQPAAGVGPATANISIDAGFNPSDSLTVAQIMSANGSATALMGQFHVWLGGGQRVLNYGGPVGETTETFNRVVTTYRGHFSWLTDETWPAVLPGTIA